MFWFVMVFPNWCKNLDAISLTSLNRRIVEGRSVYERLYQPTVQIKSPETVYK